MTTKLHLCFPKVRVEQAGALTGHILGLPIPTAAAGLARRLRLRLTERGHRVAGMRCALVIHDYALSLSRRVGPPAEGGDGKGPAIDTQPKMNLNASFLFTLAPQAVEKPARDGYAYLLSDAPPAPAFDKQGLIEALRDEFWSSRFAGGSLTPEALLGRVRDDVDPFAPQEWDEPLERLNQGPPGYVLVDRSGELTAEEDADPIERLLDLTAPRLVADGKADKPKRVPSPYRPILIGYQAVEAAPALRRTRLGPHRHIHVEDVLGLGEYRHVARLTAEDPVLWAYEAPDSSLTYPSFLTTAATVG